MACKKLTVLICTLVSVFFFQFSLFAQSQTFPSGSAIIDMGSSAPTVKNSLKPYGLIYALLKNNHVPVSLVVNANKVKDGIDFVYNGKSYRGGTYIISSDYISSQVSAVLTSWANQGVLVDYTTSDLTLNVSYKINFIPKWVMDKTNGSIAVGFLNAAGIPASAYSFKTPAQLGSCDDIFVLPHADPTWATHSNLLDWNRDSKGAIWAGCHAVSVLENLVDPNDPTRKTNFLSTNGLLSFTDHNPTNTPFSNLLPADPVAQYYSKTDNAQLFGSETVYLPKTGSSWNTGAKIITSSPGQTDVPSLSPGAAVENIYGRAFDNSTRGYVAYQAAHNIGGTSADQIAAQRVFFNFSLFALNDKIPPIITASLNGPTALAGSATLTATVTGTGTVTSYQWSASIPGSFSAPTSASTSFTPTGPITVATTCIITTVVTESCGRVSFDVKKLTFLPPSNPNNLRIVDISKNIPDGCSSSSITFNVFTNNSDPNAGTRTLLNVTGLGSGTTLTNINGDITFTPAANFKGITLGTYQITNVVSTSNAGTISITVGDATLAPVLTNDAASALVDQLTTINVLANDKNNTAAGSGVHDLLYIRDISTIPTKGFVYINVDGTLSYLSNNTQPTGTDQFQYLACNTTGYCAVGTVSVTLLGGGCSSGNYQLTTTGTTSTTTFTPTGDTFIQGAATGTNSGSATTMQVFGFSSNLKQPLIKFDVSSIGSNSTVNSASLSITTTNSFTPSGTVNSFNPATIFPVSKAWTESGATWLSIDGTTNWSTAGLGSGTDYSTSSTATITLSASVTVSAGQTLQSTSMTSIVQNWVTTSSSNNGLVIIPSSSNNTGGASQPTFHTNQTATANVSPRLLVSYATPAACITIPATYLPVVYPISTATTSALSVTISPLSASNSKNYYGRTNSLVSFTTPAQGTASISGSNIIYVPSGSFAGIDTLTYTIKDVTSNITNTGTIRITVSRAAPSINPDATAVLSGLSVTVDVNANDLDLNGPVAAAPVITSNPKNGVASVTGNSILYTPTAKFTGKDTLIYSRAGATSDNCAVPLTDTALVIITVNNRVPVANPTSISTFACAPVTIDLLTISSDPEAGVLSVTITSNPASGTLTTTGAGKYKYSPNNAFTGTDNFAYTVTDPLNATSVAATVSITVSGSANPNTAPIALNDQDNTLANQVVYTNVIGNDSDPNIDPLSISITASGLTAPLSGTIQLLPNNLIKYTPNSNFIGTDSYQYKLSDTHPGCLGNGSLSAIATVTITVTALPTTLSGTVYNDVDVSATNTSTGSATPIPTFNTIRTNTESGTNGNGSIFIYLVDNANIVKDRTPVDVDGTYSLSNVPSLTSNLKLIVSIEDVAVGNTLAATSLPNGYSNSSPLTRSLPTTTSADMGGFDWGIYVNPVLGGGIIVAPASFCGTGGIPAIITTTANATGGSLTATRYKYQWQTSTTSPTTGFTDLLVADSLTSYTPINTITTTTYYRRSVTTKNLSNVNIDATVFSNTISVTINPLPTIIITPSSGSIVLPGSIQLTASGAGTYAWTPSADLSASNTAVVTASPLTTTSFTVTGTVTSTGCTNTNIVVVTVVPSGVLLPGTIGSDQTICINGTPVAFTSTSPSSGGTGAINYQWQQGTDNTNFTNISGATSATYTPGALTQTTYYRRASSTSTNASVFTGSVKVIVQFSISGVVSGGNITVCSGANSGTLSLTGYTGSIVKWQSSVDNGTTFLDITNTASTQPFTNITASTQYRAVVQLNTCAAVNSAPISLTVTPLPVVGPISGPCALPKDTSGVYTVTAVANATSYKWTMSGGWTGTSTTNSIVVTAGAANGTISVTAFNGTCEGNTTGFAVKVIDYAQITLSGTPVTAPGNITSSIQVKIQLIDVAGNKIICSAGPATLCTSSGTFTTVVDNNDGTYTSSLVSSANSAEICATIRGIPIQKKITLTFTGPQGGIKGNGPILETETPKITFTATAGVGPFTIVYRSAKNTKNDTLNNVVSGVPIGVKLIPSNTLYTLKSVIDITGERRDNNFNRDTATILVVAPRIIVTLKADAPVLEKDSTWRTRLSLRVKNIGDLDLSNVQVKLNLKDVFPSPVTYVLDSVRVNGSSVVQNTKYDGVQFNDLFSRVNKNKPDYNRLPFTNVGGAESDILTKLNNTIDNTLGDEETIRSQGNTNSTEDNIETAADDEPHSVYMFGPLSQLAVGVDGFMYLYLHIKPNGYYEPFTMQAVALGTGRTEGATALATSLSNDNENTAAHPDITKQGDPLPTVINLIPNPVIGVALSASTPVDQGNGTYNVTLSYKLKNYGNVNLQSIKLFHNLSRMIGSPSTFTIVGPVTSTGTLIVNPGFNAKLDTNMLNGNSELGYKQEGTMQYTINITPNQLASLYRLQATASGVFAELGILTIDLSTNGNDPDPNGDKLPSEKILTIIAINLPIPPLVPGEIGININPPLRSTLLSKVYCGTASGVYVIPTSATTGGSGPYEFQWQTSLDNIVFTDILNATDTVYTTGIITSNIYLRRRVISDAQVGYSNSVYIQITPVVKPVISASGPLVLPQNGSVILTSTVATSYAWSNAAITRSITIGVAGVGVYSVTATDANGCPAVSDPVTVLPPPPVTVNKTYIIGAINNPINSGVQVTGFPGATLNYYLLTAGGTFIPVPVLPGVPGVYTYYVSQTINGFESVRVPYTVTMLDKVADLQKVLSKAPALQTDGSFLLTFNFLSSNLRNELLDSVTIKDDLTKVFPSSMQFEVVDIKASGKLITSASYNGNSQIDMLSNTSQLPPLQTDSIQLTLKVIANGFSGTLNNAAEQTAKSPYGVFKVTSNDPTVGNGLTARAPTKFPIPLIDIFIPSGFTPNRDGTNDLFVIRKPFSVSINMEIFNRWGNLVYRANDYRNDWNGKGNQPNNILGEDLPDGTYYYIVFATDKLNGSVKKFAGFITLKR